METIREGDCLEVMGALPPASVDCVITDPPYGMAYQSNWRVATRQFQAIRTEFIIFAQKGRRALSGARVGNVIEARRVPPQHIRHPTEKPVRVLRPLVQHSTAPGEVILDPFAGSGSTGVVAREEGRGFLLVEAQSEYVAVAEARLAQGNLFGG